MWKLTLKKPPKTLDVEKKLWMIFFGNSLQGNSGNCWKSPKMHFEELGALLTPHSTRGDSTKEMLWWTKSFSRSVNPNVDMTKMLWRCSFTCGRTISNAYLHVAVTWQNTTEQTKTSSMKTINWSKGLCHSQRSRNLMWIKKIVGHLDV